MRIKYMSIDDDGVNHEGVMEAADVYVSENALYIEGTKVDSPGIEIQISRKKGDISLTAVNSVMESLLTEGYVDLSKYVGKELTAAKDSGNASAPADTDDFGMGGEF